MKKVSLIALLLVCSIVASYAGLAGWITAEPRDWKFIQSAGGIDIDPVIHEAGKSLLPVTCDVSGLSIVTCRPTTMNSGLVLRKFEVKAVGKAITIRAVTSVPEGERVSKTNYIDLSRIKPGAYDVYYETAGDPQKRLGAIEIK
jgi:hypothetical protein